MAADTAAPSPPRAAARRQPQPPSPSRALALLLVLAAPGLIGSSDSASQKTTLHIPAQHLTLKECVSRARTGDEIRLQSIPTNFKSWDGGERGWHSFQGRCFVTNEVLWRRTRSALPFSGAKTVEELAAFFRKSEAAGQGTLKLEKTLIQGYGALNITGDEGVRVNGQIILASNTTGVVQGPMTLALMSDVNWALEECEPRYVSDVKCAVIVHGPDWRFDKCQIRTSGGTALRSDGPASVRLTGCAVGGMLAYDTDGRLCKAARGVCATATSKVLVEGSSIEHTEVHKRTNAGGTGVRVSDRAQVIIEDCHLHSHEGVAVQWDEFDEEGSRCVNNARVLIVNSVLKQAGVAIFSARGHTDGAQLRLSHSTLYAPPPESGEPGPDSWANGQRPGDLAMEHVKYMPTDPERARAPECFRSLFSYAPSPPMRKEDNPKAWWRTSMDPNDPDDGGESDSES
ncbi:hypothetical protein T484DRAFT_1930312, partial [Baffinella frigidus]